MGRSIAQKYKVVVDKKVLQQSISIKIIQHFNENK